MLPTLTLVSSRYLRPCLLNEHMRACIYVDGWSGWPEDGLLPCYHLPTAVQWEEQAQIPSPSCLLHEDWTWCRCPLPPIHCLGSQPYAARHRGNLESRYKLSSDKKKKGGCKGSQSCGTLKIHTYSHEPWPWSLAETMTHSETGMPRPDRCLLIVPCSLDTRAGALPSIRSCGLHPVLQSHKQPFDISERHQ